MRVEALYHRQTSAAPERGKSVKAQEMVLNTDGKGRGADFYDKPDGELLHLTNWVDCVRARKQPSSSLEAGST